MGKGEDSNIFEEAKKELQKKLEQNIDTPEPAPSLTASTIGESEVDIMLKKLRSMDEDLQKKMQRICELSGMTRKEVERFIENPHNFTDAQWRKVQQEKDQLEEKIYNAIGVKAKKRLLKKKKLKLAKGRKGKTLGGRKGWIQM